MNTTPLTCFILFSIALLTGITTLKADNTIENKPDYETELSKLNEVLKDFDDGFFGHIEVKENYIYIHFKEGKYSKFKMQDMSAPVLDTKYGQINWDCKNESMCVTTDWNDSGKESGILFSGLGGDLDYLYEKLTNFINAYSNK